MLRTFFPELSAAFFPRLALMGLSLAQPYLVNAAILYITFHETRPLNYGYGLIGAYALTYLGIAVRSSILGRKPASLAAICSDRDMPVDDEVVHAHRLPHHVQDQGQSGHHDL